jgi:RNA polymerase sigma factor (sigma-70 family)
MGENQEEFAWLFRNEYPAVVRTVALILGNQRDAEDVTQEAFLRLLAHWRRVSRYERPGAWVRRVAIRLAGRHHRARERTARLLQRLAPRSEGVVTETGPAMDDGLRAALLALPRAQRAAVVLFYLEGVPVAEIAGMLGCREATVRVHLHRARAQLAVTVGEVQDAHR